MSEDIKNIQRLYNKRKEILEKEIASLQNEQFNRQNNLQQGLKHSLHTNISPSYQTKRDQYLIQQRKIQKERALKQKKIDMEMKKKMYMENQKYKKKVAELNIMQKKLDEEKKRELYRKQLQFNYQYRDQIMEYDLVKRMVDNRQTELEKERRDYARMTNYINRRERENNMDIDMDVQIDYQSDTESDNESTDRSNKTTVEDKLLNMEDSDSSYEYDEEDGCKICMSSRINCVLIPCGHMCCCTECSTQLKQCPCCRDDINLVVKTYKV